MRSRALFTVGVFVATGLCWIGTTPASAAVMLTAGPNVNVTKTAGNQNEAGIAADPTNPTHLFLASNDDSAAFPDGLIGAVSSDGGATWATRKLADGATDTLTKACCDPKTSWDGFGNLFLVYLSASLNRTIVARSTDGGATFTQLASLPAADQPSVATGANSVWVTFEQGGAIQAAGASVTGLGVTGAFSTPQTATGSTGGNFGDIAIGPTGQVFVEYQKPSGGQGPGTIFGNLDTDGLGAGGFGAQVTVTTTNVGGFDFIPVQPDRSVDAEANLAWDRTGGTHNNRLYLAYTDEGPPNENNDTNIFVRFSDTSGTTWSTPVRVNDDATARSQFNPAIALDPTTGNIGVTFHDARNDSGAGAGDTDGVANTDAQVYGTVSVDGGATFAPNVKISAGTSHQNNSPGPGFADIDFGDYDTNTFVGGKLYAAWADNSNSTGDNPQGALSKMDVYVAAVTVQAAVASTTLTETASPNNGRAPLTVTFTYTETNTGTDPISGVTVSGSICGTATLQSGDANSNTVLDPGEVWVLTCSHTFATAGMFTDNGTANGHAVISNAPAPTETASASVTVRNPHTVLTKLASPTNGPFPLPVTFTYHEHNDGTDPISAVAVGDDTCAPLTFTGGDTNSNGILDPGETWNYTCSHTYNQPGSLTNHVTATGTDTVDSLPAPVENAQATVTVTCDHTLTGTVSGTPILGPGGAWCIVNAQVSGGVIVRPGTAVFIGNSTLGGAVNAQGATAFSLCASTVVGGAVTVENSTGFVTIGDPVDDNCGGNNIHGSVVLRNNTAGLEVVANTIGSSLQVTGTAGTGPFSEDSRAEIEANHLGSLTCSGNVPPPTSEGDLNTIAGAHTGQCAVGF
jgi:hypothetical protein